MAISGTELAKVAGALSRPLVKLLEIVENGIGALGHPLLTVLNAHADGSARLIRAGYDHRLRKLKAQQRAELESAGPAAHKLLKSSKPEVIELGPDDIEVIFDESAPSELIAARILETQQQAKRRANVVTIAAEAADSIADEVAEDPVDQDWIARFFSYAQDVSNEQLQQLWGRVLAGEVERPGKVPLRTLDLLRNMSKTDAELLKKLGARTSVDSNYLPYGSRTLSGIERLVAQDAGFIHSDERSLRWLVDTKRNPNEVPRAGILKQEPGVRELRYPSGHVIKITTDSTMYRIATYVLRPSVLPLLNLIQPGIDVEYLQSVVDALNSESYFQATLTSPET